VKKSRIIEWTVFYPDVVVWISVAKVDASWKHDVGYYVGCHAEGQANGEPTKYMRFGQWFTEGHRVWMPNLGLNDGHISFSNGRHSFAWLRDHGVRTLPITVPEDTATEVRRRFGTKSRTSRLPRKSIGLP
jgi:hypothetical protein